MSPGHIRNHAVGVPAMISHLYPAMTQLSPDTNGYGQLPCAATGCGNAKVAARSSDATMNRSTIFLTYLSSFTTDWLGRAALLCKVGDLFYEGVE